MTLISVGPNTLDLPDDKAMDLYARFSRGSNKGNKVYRTDQQGNMRLALQKCGSWTLTINQ
jgi:beta-lactamase superfamily II metal-dependent hydrolase